jgi:nitroreductase
LENSAPRASAYGERWQAVFPKKCDEPKNQKIMNVLEAIRTRRAIFPAQFSTEPISDDIVRQILAAANYAPTHKLTEPWRFTVFSSPERKAEFALLLADTYKNTTAEEQFSPAAYKKYQTVPTKASHVIAIGMHRDEAERVPEWEEIAATAMAVQNMWLAATQLGVGGYWGTPTVAAQRTIADFLQFDARTTCYGLFYLAHHNAEPTEARREPIEAKTVWI